MMLLLELHGIQDVACNQHYVALMIVNTHLYTYFTNKTLLEIHQCHGRYLGLRPGEEQTPK